MIESLAITLPPVLFLIVLFGGGAAFRRQNINMDGDAPISRTLFYGSKYTIVLIWAAMVVQVWGVDLSSFMRPPVFRWVSLCLWFLGFALLFIGRFGLGDAFRIGSPQESTSLKVDGLFALSRNPMYVGVYSTLIASVLYTASPFVLLAAGFAAAVHHRIVLAEEHYLRERFGSDYVDYCRRVRRYL